MTENSTENLDSDISAEVDGIEGEQLRQFIERVERLEEEKSVLGDHVREVYAEAKSSGFDPKIMRKIVRIRKMDPRDVDEEDALIDLYKRVLGMA